ncbi:MAG: STAS domain-containing protein [Betaproteobacteria bacterium]|nr:STAS domain-containing protein [Betaproteobacteria bacterium]
MVFSLFGKKPQPEPAKPAAQKAPQAPAPSRPSAAAEPAPPAAPKEELGSLDFTAPGAIEVHEEDLPGHFEIRESTASMHPVVEEAAILFANGQDEAALASLEGAAPSSGLGTAADQVWAMLFDLYQAMGKRELFDKRALEYSVKYEKSPPTWVEPAKQSLGPALTTGGTAFVAFAGTLGEGADKTIRQLEKIISANPVARVEFGKLQSVDVLGAALLLKTMKAARKAKCELVMSGADKLADLLKSRIEVGRREDETLWMLLLELFQHMALQEPFEEWAVNYAITFEVSPPSWENRPPPKKPMAAAAPAATPAEPNVFPLSGEMYSAGSDAFRQLVDFAGGREQVSIDCSALKRMDFVSAGLFLNTLANLQITGCSVTIRNPNELIYALFVVLGINQVAHVERRKF